MRQSGFYKCSNVAWCAHYDPDLSGSYTWEKCTVVCVWWQHQFLAGNRAPSKEHLQNEMTGKYVGPKLVKVLPPFLYPCVLTAVHISSL